MTDDADVRSFLATFAKVSEIAARFNLEDADRPRFTAAVTDYLGTDATMLNVLTESVPNHRYLDWDVALSTLMEADDDGALLGLGGGQERYDQSLADIVANRWAQFPVGQIDYVNLPSGPQATHQAIGLGARCFRYRGEPVVVFQRRGSAAGEGAAVDVMALQAASSVALLDDLRRLADEHSVLRGQVLTLGLEEGHIPTYRFLDRATVPATDVILPEGTLERIGVHVQGIAANAERLRALGQHLKRGLLLYGPPGTGKTHTVRHLLGELPEHTVVLLRGQALTMISQAAQLARAMQPAVVVLEDVDLVAEDRSFSDGSTPLLFEVLDAVDGIDTDVDVTFILTTNRIEVLEEALVQRPGRVDLAVEIPLPDLHGRLRLLELYSRGIDFSDGVLATAAERSEGMTGSFAKELTRRAVLRAIAEDRPSSDADLLAAVEEQIRDTEVLRRHLVHDSVEIEDAVDAQEYNDDL